MVLHGNPPRDQVPATESLHLNGKCISIFTALRSGEILMLSAAGKRVGQQSKLTINNSLKNFFKRYTLSTYTEKRLLISYGKVAEVT